ncbi:18097_t:CDS:10 [Acaulospora morrowiae]|uniref:non-specific serine/threonine protein kinase n=1 Tax=Acaulospora morrowiae TaxID=94023 RepID=A0A9N8VQE9_9GLOM|nr:18097_t:CDS:10 [Acaulospora morrowiae]
MASSNRSQNPRVSKELSIGNYIIGEELGHGSFATVYKGYNKKTHKKVAIKSVLRSKLTKKLLENLESEINILKSIRHDYIVQLVDCQKSDTHIHLIMEYCSLGDLSNYIKRRGSSLSKSPSSGGLEERVVRHFLKQLANALEFLRSRNLIHRDIKPQNLLLLPPPSDKDKEASVGSSDLPILKIADFGFARSLPSTNLAETLCGSPLYMAPEILRYEKYDAKADLWSVGAVLYEMSVGKPPFRAQNHFELLGKIEKRRDRIKFPDELVSDSDSIQSDSDKNPNNKGAISEELKDLIRHLLKRDPVERMSFEEFFMHPCVTGEFQSRKSYGNIPAKEKLVNVKPNNPKNSAENDISKRHVRDRSISSPVPVSFKEEVGTNQTGRAFHNYTRTNITRRDIDSSPKGIANVLGGDHTNLLQRKTSRESVKHHQILQRTTKHPNIVTEVSSNNVTDLVKKNDNNSLQVHNDLQPSYENPSPTPSLLVQTPKNNEEDVNFLREYVMVDSKRTVEVNSLADELAASPKSLGLVQKHSNKGNSMGITGIISPSSPLDPQYRNSVSNHSPYNVIYSTTPPFALPPSQERVGSAGSTSSASSALARALSGVSLRLFRTGNSPPLWSDRYSKQKGNAISFPSDAMAASPEDVVIKTIEDFAYKAHVVYQFAETKYHQLLPPPPTASSELIDMKTVSAENATTLAQEAFVLYLKCLSLLQSAMDSAREYWTSVGKQQSDHPNGKEVSSRLNQAVQWVRTKFNECLEKAEYAKSRCPTEEAGASNCFVEKLLYDKACEMSRQAALNELMCEDLFGCESAYRSAIYMLNAVLENTPEDGNSLDDHDRQVVNKFIVEITKRLNSLQKKLTQSDVPVISSHQGSPG